MKIDNIEQHGDVTVVRITYTSNDEYLKLLIRSDAHHDSINNLRDLEKRHLDQAVADDAYILDFGDLFDAMQGRNDPRRGYQELRPEFKVDKYFNAVVDDAKKFYEPYANRWLLMAKGNHEASVLKNTQLDLTSLPARQAVYLPDADIVVNGHNHNAYVVPLARERLTDNDRVFRDIAYYLRAPGYKDQGEWEREKMFAPTPHGAIWVSIRINKDAKPEITCHTAFD